MSDIVVHGLGTVSYNKPLGYPEWLRRFSKEDLAELADNVRYAVATANDYGPGYRWCLVTLLAYDIRGTSSWHARETSVDTIEEAIDLAREWAREKGCEARLTRVVGGKIFHAKL